MTRSMSLAFSSCLLFIFAYKIIKWMQFLNITFLIFFFVTATIPVFETDIASLTSI